MLKFHQKNGQAVVELALFGSVALIVLGVFVTYVQKLNDRQFTKMESFRRALQKANTFQGDMAESPGASVSLERIEHRRYVDVYNNELGKGNVQVQDADATVFWAVAAEGISPDDTSLAHINDEEVNGSVSGQFNIDNKSELLYQEYAKKGEDPSAMGFNHTIDNMRISKRKEKLNTQASSASIEQWSYRDPNGQYRYSKDVPEGDTRIVQKGKLWSTK